jgi:internalin A
LKELAQFKSLRKLSLNEIQVTDKGWKELAPLTNLNELELNDSDVTDRVLAALREINLLHALWLAGTNGEKRPAKPEEVTKLELVLTRMTGVGLKELRSFKNLKSLQLPGIKLTDEIIKDLAGFDKLNELTKHHGPFVGDRSKDRLTFQHHVSGGGTYDFMGLHQNLWMIL